MFLESITISGFRGFGPEPTSIPLSKSITALVGPNAAGKTALLQGLAKLFGISRTQRMVQKSDFHLGPGDNPDSQDAKELFIDVLIALPELVDETATPESIAPIFYHMQIRDNADCPVCRLRLEAQWKSDGTIEGEVLQDIFWVHTLATDLEKDEKQPATPAERGLIQLYYTPASRDAGSLTRTATGILTARILRAVEWSPKTKETVTKASKDISGALEDEMAITWISKALQQRWFGLHDEIVDTKPRFSLASRRFEEIVRQIAVIFEQAPDGHERSLHELSDGQQSLFYFAIAAAVFDLESQVVSGEAKGFRDDQLSIPALSIFALEEPENHLSPYYLARIIRQVRSLANTNRAQSILTSHSPAILSRIKPHEVRYCRFHYASYTSSVKSIKMPTKKGEAGKFVRGAMLAYPELYFARFVLLVEGDSERIVLPHIAKADGMLIDSAFVAIVPLGGRHVEHFWRLLFHLGIPHATLLDLDLGRVGGGFGRVKTIIKKLIDFGVSESDLLSIEEGVLSNEDFENMHTWQDVENLECLSTWIDCLKEHGVFFSEPLDFDLTMLKYFPEAYAATIPSKGGPRMNDNATNAVFGTAGPGPELYTGKFKDYMDLLSAYRYHFLTHSKPATHLAALTHIDPKVLGEDTIPPVLIEVVRYIASNLRRD